MSKPFTSKSASLVPPRSPRHSPAGSATGSSQFHTRQVTWPGSKSRMSITAWNDESQGPGCAITYHDATITQRRSEEGDPNKSVTVDPAPFGRDYGSSVSTGATLPYGKAITQEGTVIQPPHLVGSDFNPFESDTLLLPASTSRYSQELLNNGAAGAYRSSGGGSSRQPENMIGDEARKVLSELWSKLDMQETNWSQLPLRCTRLHHLKTGKFTSKGEEATLACPVQFIFSQERLKEKDMESGRDLHLPPAASSHEPPYEEESYWRNRSPYNEHCRRGKTSEIEGITALSSYDIKYQQGEIERQDRLNRFNPTAGNASPTDTRPEINVVKGEKNGEPWMRISTTLRRYASPVARTLSALLRVPPTKHPQSSEVKLVPFPIRDVANFSVTNLTGPDGESIELDQLFGNNATTASVHTAYAWPAGAAPGESLTWTEHGEHSLYKTLGRVIKSLGPEWSSLPCSEIAVRGLRNTKTDYYTTEAPQELPVSLTYTYCHPQIQVEDPMDVGEEQEDIVEIAQVGVDDPDALPPPYMESPITAAQVAPQNTHVEAVQQRSRRKKSKWSCF